MAIKNFTKDINTNDVSEVITLGKKILKILYIFLIVGSILCAFLFCKTVGVFTFLGTLLKVLCPLFIGFVIAWLFNPIVLKLKNKGMNKYLSAMLVYVVFIVFLIVFFKIFIPVMYDQVNDFVKQLPGILQTIINFINDTFNKIGGDTIDLTPTRDALIMNVSNIMNNATQNLPSDILNIIIKLFSGIGTFAMGMLIGLYMLFDFDNITNLVIKLIPDKNKTEVIGLIDNIGREVRKTVNGTLLVASMVFVCDTVGFAIIGLNGAFLFGLFCGITDLIPYIGPYIGAGVAAIVGFSQSPILGIGILIIALIVQIIENYVLQPVVMSKATQIHPIIIILGLLVFGHFFGIVGMILATPVLSILKVVYKFCKNKYFSKKSIA